MNTIDGMINDLESDETVIGGCTTVGEIVIALKSLKERKKGKWENKNTVGHYFYGKCSKCGQELVIDMWYTQNMKFCPNCGTKMESEG